MGCLGRCIVKLYIMRFLDEGRLQVRGKGGLVVLCFMMRGRKFLKLTTIRILNKIIIGLFGFNKVDVGCEIVDSIVGRCYY